MEPLLEAQPDEELRLGVPLRQLLHAGVREVVVVRMGNDHGIDRRQLRERTCRGRVPLGAEPLHGRAAIFKYGVEQHAQAAGELDKVAGVAEPSGTQRC